MWWHQRIVAAIGWTEENLVNFRYFSPALLNSVEYSLWFLFLSVHFLIVYIYIYIYIYIYGCVCVWGVCIYIYIYIYACVLYVNIEIRKNKIFRRWVYLICHVRVISRGHIELMSRVWHSNTSAYEAPLSRAFLNIDDLFIGITLTWNGSNC